MKAHSASIAPASGSTKDRIKSVALELFLTHGYRGASVRDIASANGTTVPTLYYHFGNKDGLLAAIVAPFADAGDGLIAELEALSLSPDRFAVEALGGYYDVLAAHLDVFRFVSNDLAVRSHVDAGHRLAAQGARFVDLLAGPAAVRNRRICAVAAVGAVRRSLRSVEIDPQQDRAQVLAAAVAAYRASSPPAARRRSTTSKR